MKKRLNKLGVSPIIATVLLLLITVVAAGLISLFVVPFVQKSLTDSGECFQIRQGILVGSTPYLCHASSTNDRTSFSVKVESDKVIGFTAVMYSGDSAQTFEVTNGTNTNGIWLLENGALKNELKIPPVRGVRTYVVSGIYDKVELYPIVLSGNKCDMTDSIELKPCTDNDVAATITNPAPA